MATFWFHEVAGTWVLAVMVFNPARSEWVGYSAIL
jgi:hypothetical protein